MAFIFVIGAIVITMLIASLGDDIHAIIGRITAIAIAIGAATFCAKQYTRQKDIAENYAYKMVLAKSILAFADEIKRYDPTQSIAFLEGAIKEINRSPAHKDKDITKNQNRFFCKYMEMIKIRMIKKLQDNETP